VVDPTGNKIDFVAFNNAFHGSTMRSLSVTLNPKYQKPFSPMVPGFRYGDYNDVAQIIELVTALQFLHALARIAAPEPHRVVPRARDHKRRVGRERDRVDDAAMALQD
jgi:4-aminobutyrate aminotransferase-like enzyme